MTLVFLCARGQNTMSSLYPRFSSFVRRRVDQHGSFGGPEDFGGNAAEPNTLHPP